jgi:hypothetical protein
MGNPNDTKTLMSLVEAANSINKPTPKFRVGDRVAIVDKDGRVLDLGTIDRVDDYDPYQQTYKYRIASERISNRKFWNESSLRKVGADYREAVEPTDDLLDEEGIDEARDYNDPNRIRDNLTHEQRKLQSESMILLGRMIDDANSRVKSLQKLVRRAEGVLTTIRTNPTNPIDDITAEEYDNLLRSAVEFGILTANAAKLFSIKGRA